MYDFVVDLAEVCKDFAIPIFGALALLTFIFYLNKRGNFYKAMTKLICSSVEYIEAETKKTNNNIRDFQTVKGSLEK